LQTSALEKNLKTFAAQNLLTVMDTLLSPPLTVRPQSQSSRQSSHCAKKQRHVGSSSMLATTLEDTIKQLATRLANYSREDLPARRSNLRSPSTTDVIVLSSAAENGVRGSVYTVQLSCGDASGVVEKGQCSPCTSTVRVTLVRSQAKPGRAGVNQPHFPGRTGRSQKSKATRVTFYPICVDVNEICAQYSLPLQDQPSLAAELVRILFKNSIES
jgi:hypothetical protein